MRLFLESARLWAWLGIVGFGAGATILVLAPALGTGAEGPTTFSGSTTGAVAYSTNSSTGTAIEGVTGTVAGGKALWGLANNALHAGTGVRASAYGPSSFGLIGEALNTDKTHPSYGLYATSKSSYAVYATTAIAGLTSLFAINTDTTSATSHAIKGQSAGNAITGISTKANGVVGQVSATPTPVPSAIIALAGVLGQDLSSSSFNAGVAGKSGLGTAVAGSSFFGTGVHGASINFIGIDAENRNSGKPALTVSGGDPLGTASSVAALMIINYKGSYPAMQNCNASGSPITHMDVASVDQFGDLILCGTSKTSSAPLVVHRTASAQFVGTYSTQQSIPSVEDFGEARLANGQAYVRIDPSFATVIDHRVNYLVFITPQGATPGLYVTQKSMSGFAVREYSGHSSIAFDYRIVAKPIDSGARRLPLMRPILAARGPQRRLDYSAGYIPKPPRLPAILQQTIPHLGARARR